MMSYSLAELDNLSQEEREIALKILNEYSNTGSSDTYNELLYVDFKEIPVDIITFIKDEKYLGKAWHLPNGKCKLFPFWEKKLRELFPDNVSTNYNTLIESGARGLGKSEIAVACGLYMMYRLMCLRNPYEYLNLKPTEQVAFAFMNITEALALDIGINKFQKTVQLSPWFMERGTLSGKSTILWNPPNFINIIVGSQSRHVIGQAIYFAFFDEISFIPNQDIEAQKKKAIDMIDTAIGGMATRFTNRGKNPTLLVLGSSKRSEKSFLEQHILKKQETDADNTMIVDEPVWNVRPASEYSGKRFKVALGNKFLVSQVLKEDEIDTKALLDRGYRIIDVPIEYKAKFLEDIDRALCDYAGISSSELSTYISGVRFAQCKNENLKNAFIKDIIEVGNSKEDRTQYYNFFDLSVISSQMKAKPLFIHLDMSVSGDKTGIAGVWIKKKRITTDDGNRDELTYQVAFSVSVKAPKGHQVSFKKNRDFIYWLKEQGFNIKGISTDSFQSTDTGQELIDKGFNYKVISVDKVDSDRICKPYQYLRSAIYEERLEIYDKCDLLTDEIVSLERNINTGKVDHPANGSKDQSDAICGAMFHASQNAEQFAFDFGETIETIVNVSNTNSGNMASDKQQMKVAFEEELTKLLDPISKQKAKEEKEQIENTAKLNDSSVQSEKPKSPFKDFGMGPAEVYKPQYLMNGIIYW